MKNGSWNNTEQRSNREIGGARLASPNREGSIAEISGEVQGTVEGYSSSPLNHLSNQVRWSLEANI